LLKGEVQNLFFDPSFLHFIFKKKIIKTTSGKGVNQFSLDEVQIEIGSVEIKSTIVVDHIYPQYGVLDPERTMSKGVVEFIASGAGKETYL
jgi:alcohol dehydrogenase class IV